MGIILNTQGSVLILKDRRKRWTLAGGQIDKHESQTKALLREVREETGLKIKLLKKLWKTTKKYGKKNKKRAKVFLSLISKKASRKLKLSFEHLKAKWVKPKMAFKKLITRHAKALKSLI
jgi:8-oxo-dGTP pyrophosphatase MutT (NUDIX family)